MISRNGRGSKFQNGIYVFVLFSLIGIFPLDLAQAYPPTLCAPYLGSCDYYSCRDSIQTCGPRGYWLRFGYPYCDRFMTEVRPGFSLEGQDWLDRVGQCLRDKVETFPLTLSCGEVEQEAIDSHSPCYLETGFCQIRFWEKLKILRLVFRELSDSRFRKVFMEIALGCHGSFSSQSNPFDFENSVPDFTD